MNWNVISTAILAALAAGGVGVSYKIFEKIVVRHDDKKAADMDMGTSWDKYKPLITESKAWIIEHAEQHYITTSDGLRLSGKYITAAVPTHKTVIAFHGYRSCGTYEFSVITDMYHKHNFNVMLVDNRAHGESEGNHIGFGALDRYDVCEWAKYVSGQIDSEAEIYLHGISMGGASVLMASCLDLPDNVKGLISDCAFTSAKDIMETILSKKSKIPMKPFILGASGICKKVAGYSFNQASTLDALSRTTLPVLFIHGTADTFVPPEMTQKNYDVCVSEKQLIMVEGAGHAECFYHSPELYEKSVFDFIDNIK